MGRRFYAAWAGRAKTLDDATEERLLSGAMGAADAPPGYAAVAGMLAAARPKAAEGSIPGETRALQAYRAAIAGTPLLLPEERGAKEPTHRARMIARVPAKVAVAGALVLVGGTAAAAATGSLPGPLQSTASSVLSHVGISVPSSSAPVNPHPSANASPHATEGADNSLYGLCTAYASRGSSSQASVPSRLSAAAVAAGESVTQFCNSVPNPSSVNPASSPSAHKSDEAGTVQKQSSGSGGPAGPGSAVTHSGTPGPPADQGQGQPPGSGKPAGSGQPAGQGQGSGASGTNNGNHNGQTTTTVPPTTTTTVKGKGGGSSANDTPNGKGSGTGKH